MEWFTNVMPSILIGIVLAVIVFLIIRSKIRERKRGGYSCGCPGCSGTCPHSAGSNIKQHEEKRDEIK